MDRMLHSVLRPSLLRSCSCLDVPVRCCACMSSPDWCHVDLVQAEQLVESKLTGVSAAFGLSMQLSTGTYKVLLLEVFNEIEDVIKWCPQ